MKHPSRHHTARTDRLIGSTAGGTLRRCVRQSRSVIDNELDEKGAVNAPLTKIERLARYVSRPPVATERLSLTLGGNVRYALKTPYRDGTTHRRFRSTW